MRHGPLDITWLKDASLEDSDALLPPEVIAQEIVEGLDAARAISPRSPTRWSDRKRDDTGL